MENGLGGITEGNKPPAINVGTDAESVHSAVVNRTAGTSGGIPLVYAPTSWLDAAGHILLPGLYKVALAIDHHAAFTAPVLMQGATAFDAIEIFTSDDILTYQINITDVLALGVADLPWNTNPALAIPADATGTVDVSQAVYRLAH